MRRDMEERRLAQEAKIAAKEHELRMMELKNAQEERASRIRELELRVTIAKMQRGAAAADTLDEE